jgi:xanthine/uracil permease
MDIQPTISWLNIIAVVGAVLAMLYGLNMVYKRIKAKGQGFGPNTLKAIGVVLFIPTILILAIVTKFQPETLAALLGTVAGYVLSNSKPEE